MRVRIKGDFAIFSRGETRSEPYSYPVPPRTVITGILESVFWKPEMDYVINQLIVCRPIHFVNFKRNGINDRQKQKIIDISDSTQKTQRNFYCLTNVEYVVDFSILLTAIAQKGESEGKYYAQVERRLKNGQQFKQPFLGCREFIAYLSFVEDGEFVQVADELLGVVEDFGLMPKALNWIPDPKGAVTGIVHDPATETGSRTRYVKSRVVPEFESVIMKNGIIQYV